MNKLFSRIFVAALMVSTSAVASAFAQDKVPDDFFFLDKMNRASAVVLHENEVLNDEQAAVIAAAIDKVNLDANEPGFPRAGYYLGLEPKYLEAGGDEVSRLHVGRSTIDMGAARERMIYRGHLLNLYGEMIEARRAMLDLAAKTPNAILPAYTLNVQAQPTSLGHYITGYTSVFDRQATLIEQTYANVNLSPMGVAALGTSSFPIDRHRLSVLLGFDGTIRNSFDAALIGSAETSMMVNGAVNSIAVTASQLLSDLESQYRQVTPWFTFPVNMTGGSSIMPQKLNPNGINTAQRGASRALGYTALHQHFVHKTGSGDVYDLPEGAQTALKTIIPVIDGIENMFKVFNFNEQRALNEVLGDYAVATEFANELQRLTDIPFRQAHHLSGVLVQYGRDNGLKPIEIAFSDFVDLYAQQASAEGLPDLNPAFSEEVFNRLMRPENMVEASKGYGGPQAAEVTAMLEEGYARLAEDEAWLAAARERLAAADSLLNTEFAELTAVPAAQ